MATKNGLIKKTPISEFESIRKGGKIAIKLNEGDSLIGAYVTTDNDQIVLASNNGKCIRFKETDIRLVGRDAIGVRGIKLADDDYLVDSVLIKEGYDIMTVTENGYGKRSRQEEYKLQGRYGLGVMAGVFNEQTGRLIGLKQISDEEDLILICDDGQVIRLKASEINTIGRNTKGVKLMRVKEGTKVTSIAVVPTEEEKSEDETSAEAPADIAPETPTEIQE